MRYCKVTFTVEQVKEGIAKHLLSCYGNVSPQFGFRGVVVDSRQGQPGALFVALRGQHNDGHMFVDDAIAHGATGVIVAKDSTYVAGSSTNVACFVVDDTLLALQSLAAYWRDQHRVRVIGVTGSVGKTTTKELVAAVLSQHFHVVKSEGNLNTEIGLPISLLQLEPGHQVAVLEMGMYGVGEITALCRIAQPSIGIVTNVGPVHLERLGTIANIAAAKAELVAALPEDGYAVLNGDDPWVRAMASITTAHVLLYGHDPAFDLWVDEESSQGLQGIRFRIHYGPEEAFMETPLLGLHSVYPALSAATTAVILGLTLEEIGQALREPGAMPRLRLREGINGCTIIDDTYNASPASAIAALNVLREAPGRKIAVLGDMLELGSYTETGHKEVGRHAASVADKLVVLGELGHLIGLEAQECGLKEVLFASSQGQVVTLLRELLLAGDCVLVKGSRGLAMERIVASLSS